MSIERWFNTGIAVAILIISGALIFYFASSIISMLNQLQGITNSKEISVFGRILVIWFFIVYVVSAFLIFYYVKKKSERKERYRYLKFY